MFLRFATLILPSVKQSHMKVTFNQNMLHLLCVKLIGKSLRDSEMEAKPEQTEQQGMHCSAIMYHIRHHNIMNY